VREAWRRGQKVNVIGVIYDIHDGLLKQLGIEYCSQKDWESNVARIGWAVCLQCGLNW